MKDTLALFRFVTPARTLAAAMAAALLMTTMLSTGRTATGAPLPVVEMAPALHNVTVGDGPFNVTIEVKELLHNGRSTYDVNRDGEPDVFVPSIGLASFTFTIHYDTDILRVQGAQQGPDLGKTGRAFSCFNATNEELETYTYACASTGEQEGLQGSVVLARIEFMPVGAGHSFLELDGELSGPYSDDIPADIKGAAVIVDSNETDPEPPDVNVVDPQGDLDGDTVLNSADDSDDDGASDAVDPTPFGVVGPDPQPDSPDSGDDDPRGEVSNPGDPGDGPGDSQRSNSANGDGNNFMTTMLIALGVFAGAGVLGTAGYSAWRVRRGS